MMLITEPSAAEKEPLASLALPAIGGSWTLEQLEALAGEAARRGVPAAQVVAERNSGKED